MPRVEVLKSKYQINLGGCAFEAVADDCQQRWEAKAGHHPQCTCTLANAVKYNANSDNSPHV